MALPEELRGSYPNSFWEDLALVPKAVDPIGPISGPDEERDTGLFLFDPDKIERVAATVQMPHAWAEGTAIFPHVHWTKTSADPGDVVWGFRFRFSNFGEVLTAMSPMFTFSEPQNLTVDHDLEDEHLITSLTVLPMADQSISTVVLLEVCRAATEVEDTYPEDARMLGVDIHFLANQPGSVLIHSKYPRDQQNHDPFYSS
jgi:hypothetical protein